MKKLMLSTALLVSFSLPAFAETYVPYSMQRSVQGESFKQMQQRLSMIEPAAGNEDALSAAIEAEAAPPGEPVVLPEAEIRVIEKNEPAPAPEAATLSDVKQANVTHGANWSYGEGPRGPASWGALSPANAACSSGLKQSPIDITQFAQEDLAEFKPFYKDAPIDIYNGGNTLTFMYEAGSGFTVEGKGYKLRQFDFHTPSEHTIMGVPSPMELQLVHQADDGTLAVVAVMIKAGAPNKYIEAFLQNTPAVTGGRKRINTISINAAEMLPDNLDYYRYDGSLTVPPCTENVLWFVLKEGIEASPAQINAFQKKFPGNARPVQALNDRLVKGD